MGMRVEGLKIVVTGRWEWELFHGNGNDCTSNATVTITIRLRFDGRSTATEQFFLYVIKSQ